MDEPYDRITVPRARVLRELAEGYLEREIAERIGATLPSVRGHVEELKEVTGCGNVRALGRWWREHRERWLAHVAAAAGIG